MAIVLVVEIYTFFCPKGAAYFMDVLPPKGQWVGCGDLYSWSWWLQQKKNEKHQPLLTFLLF